MRQLNVDLGDRSYPIYIGEKLLANKQFLAPYIQGRQIWIDSRLRFLRMARSQYASVDGAR